MNIENGNPAEEELDPDGLTAEQRALAESFLADVPTTDLSASERRECEREVTELQGLLDAFETKHPLEALSAITDLSPEDAPHHPVREPARKDLIPIVALLNTLQEQTNISEERLTELKARYLSLSKAVGIVNNGKVRH